MAVHQLVPTFAEGDATGTAAIHFQLLLRRLGVWSEVYAGEVSPELTSLVRPASQLRPAEDDLVLYHHGIASPLAGRLMHLPCRRGVVFHNISPVKVYAGAPIEEALRSGRAQLAAMAEHVELAIGVSDFNARELRAAGYTNVHTVPLFIEKDRFTKDRADPRMLARLKHDGITVLSVSRVMPHKRFEDLISLHEELLRLEPRARLVLVGGYDAGSAYFKKLKRRARGLPGVEFVGRVSHSELVAAYRSANVFVSMSEHEGFGVPLIEAMAAEVPVVAYGAAAVPETLNGAGICFDSKEFAALAEVVRDAATNPKLRTKVLRGQERRLQELSPENAQERLRSALKLEPPKAKPPRRKPRIGFLVQRYGDVSGGAELLARQLAEQLVPHWDITVLTTCAKDHVTWENAFPPGPQKVGPVKVLRFPVARPRNMRAFNAYCRKIFGKPIDRVREEHFVAEQGPLARGLFRHLEDRRADYDGFVCFTYLYSNAAWGLPMVADRAIMITTAHDEAPIAFQIYRDVFDRPRALFCLTPEERKLIDRLFPAHAPAKVVSVGVEGHADAKPERFRKKHDLHRPYLFYVGRVEAGKGIPELIQHHQALVRTFHDAPDLVLAGAASMEVRGDRVRYLGRISEEDKYDALTGAMAAVVPSKYESLSLLTLEAFAQGTPALVNGESDVLAGQITRSGAGRAYTDRETFIEGVRAIGAERDALGRMGKAFAKTHSWAKVVDAYVREMEKITG